MASQVIKNDYQIHMEKMPIANAIHNSKNVLLYLACEMQTES